MQAIMAACAELWAESTLLVDDADTEVVEDWAEARAAKAPRTRAAEKRMMVDLGIRILQKSYTRLVIDNVWISTRVWKQIRTSER